MSKVNLKKDENDLLKGYESGEFKSTLSKKRKEFLMSAAEETFRKDKRINIRISSRDLESIQRRALEEGIPYQTLVSSILHKYVSGSFKSTTDNN
jgi:predicted DNA binding CopG/RHH family protein